MKSRNSRESAAFKAAMIGFKGGFRFRAFCCVALLGAAALQALGFSFDDPPGPQFSEDAKRAQREAGKQSLCGLEKSGQESGPTLFPEKDGLSLPASESIDDPDRTFLLLPANSGGQTAGQLAELLCRDGVLSATRDIKPMKSSRASAFNGGGGPEFVGQSPA